MLKLCHVNVFFKGIFPHSFLLSLFWLLNRILCFFVVSSSKTKLISLISTGMDRADKLNMLIFGLLFYHSDCTDWL